MEGLAHRSRRTCEPAFYENSSCPVSRPTVCFPQRRNPAQEAGRGRRWGAPGSPRPPACVSCLDPSVLKRRGVSALLMRPRARARVQGAGHRSGSSFMGRPTRRSAQDHPGSAPSSEPDHSSALSLSEAPSLADAPCALPVRHTRVHTHTRAHTRPARAQPPGSAALSQHPLPPGEGCAFVSPPWFSNAPPPLGPTTPSLFQHAQLGRCVQKITTP